MRALIIVTLFTLVSVVALAAETDHYTHSDQPLADAADIVNSTANAYLKKGIETLNAEGPCDNSEKSENALLEEMTNYFANHYKGQFIKDIIHSEAFPKRMFLKSESIYGNWEVRDGFLLGRKGSEDSQLGILPLMRVGSNFIGIDKFEHMFGMGLIYYKGVYRKKKPLHEVLKNGIFREKTVLGGNILATGVFSYGDLSANFNGFRFWNHMLQKHDDVLGAAYNVGPYVKCENSVWKVTRNTIDFRNYIDASMDESINCRKLASGDGLKRSRQAMVERGFGADSCPADRNLLNLMYSKYDITIKADTKQRPISHWIINQNGLGTVNYFKEFE